MTEERVCVGVCLWGRGSDRRRSEATGGQVEEMKHRKRGLEGWGFHLE